MYTHWNDLRACQQAEKRARERRKDRNEKSNKSEWYSPPSVGRNARCNVNHDALTVHPGPSWHYTTSCLRFTTCPITSSRDTGAEIDVYSQPVDIFQLHNQQIKYFNISQAAVTEPWKIEYAIWDIQTLKRSLDSHLSRWDVQERLRKFRQGQFHRSLCFNIPRKY